VSDDNRWAACEHRPGIECDACYIRRISLAAFADVFADRDSLRAENARLREAAVMLRAVLDKLDDAARETGMSAPDEMRNAFSALHATAWLDEKVTP
jgi:hypothetical protein